MMMQMHPGGTLGPYQILEQLGAGGMGAVYRAHDTRLGRDVALKVLLPDSSADPISRRRLLNEAKAASALNHPNAVTVYEASTADGVDYIAMEFIAGQTLGERLEQGPLPQREALSIALQVAEGLSAAHQVGLVHRDLKPSNIMVMPDGRAKILDFGLARQIEVAASVGASGITQTASLTIAGSIVGTLAYMSPEQARGEAPGPASDMFAFGAILYQSLSGQHPFPGKSALVLFHQICFEDPAPLHQVCQSIPPQVSAIAAKALAKKPQARFASMTDLIEALRPLANPQSSTSEPSRRLFQSAVPAVASWKIRWMIIVVLSICAIAASVYYVWNLRPQPVDSVAVLPFVNATSDPSNDYLVEGLSDTLRRDLSRVNGLTVASADSVQRFRGSGYSPINAADRLRVGAVMTGKVSAAGPNLHLNVELVNAATGKFIWTESYDLPRTEMVRMADRLWADTADQLGRKLGSSKARHQPTPKAYDLYLKGQSSLARRGLKDVQQAVGLFQQATEEDPNYALAYAGLADAYQWIANFGEQPAVTMLPHAKEAARRAVELDSNLAEAQLSYATAISLTDFDWEGAEKAFRRAIALDPRSAKARSAFALIGLVPLKRFEEATIESQRAIQLEPDSPLVLFRDAEVMHFARHYDESLRILSAIKAPSMLGPVNAVRAFNLIQMQRPADAITLLSNDRSGQYSAVTSHVLGFAFASLGEHAKAEKMAREAETQYKAVYSSPYNLASLFLPLNQPDKAIRWLRECRSQGDFNLRFITVDPRWDPIRSDPNFQDLAKSIGLQ